MYNIKKLTTWFGKYQSKLGDIIVVHDRRIIPSDPSRIYLYHTGRDEFVEYIENIIAANLSDLSDEEALQAEKDYKQKWLDAITKQGMSVIKETNKRAVKSTVKKEKINWNESNKPSKNESEKTNNINTLKNSDTAKSMD